MKRLLLAALVFLGLISIGHADGIPRYAVLGYCYNSSLSSAAGLSSFTNGPGSAVCNGVSAPTMSTYGYIVFCAYGANVNWLDTGTPTATVGSGGQQLSQNSCMAYVGSNPAGIRFIQQTAGATVGAMIYTVPGTYP